MNRRIKYDEICQVKTVVSPILASVIVYLIFITTPIKAELTTEDVSQISVISALIRFSYTDPTNGKFTEYQGELGRYGRNSPVHPISGRVVHVQGEDGMNHGCSVPVNIPHGEQPWIALVQRGHCQFEWKIINNAVFANASAVVIYDNVEDDKLITMHHEVDHVVSVFIGKSDGDILARLADQGIGVRLDISIGQIIVYDIVSSKDKLQAPVKLVLSLAAIATLVVGLSILIAFKIRRLKRRKKTLLKGNIVVNNSENVKHIEHLLDESPEGHGLKQNVYVV